MKVYGLTGGVGMGKSTSDKLLRERGLAVVDTDEIARQIVEPGQPALREIQAAFGSEITDQEGRLRRKDLARLVFEDVVARKKLEEILHPRITVIWHAQVQTWRKAGFALAAVVLPLLFETSAAGDFDAIICVSCSSETQRRRLLARGWDREHLEKRIATQWPIGRKMELANFVVWTEAGVDVHAAQIDRIIST